MVALTYMRVVEAPGNQALFRPEVPGRSRKAPVTAVPTLVTAAGQQVLGGHLHVDTPAGADTDPVRNGFHSPECLQEKPRLVSYP